MEKKLPTNRQIEETLKRLKKPLEMKYSAEGVWFRANPFTDSDGRVTAFGVTFKYYSDCVDTGEAGYCYVRINGIEFRHWPYYKSDWNAQDSEGWKCQSELEDDGVTDEELSALIDEHVVIPEKIVVDQVEFQMASVMSMEAMAECLLESSEWGQGDYYRDEEKTAVYQIEDPSEAKERGLIKVTPMQAAKMLYGNVELECQGAC